jgi:hypothetical protein
MNIMSNLIDVARSPGDPPSALEGVRTCVWPADRLARTLGGFSIAAGLTELLAARRKARARAFMARELDAGVMSLSMSPRPAAG